MSAAPQTGAIAALALLCTGCALLPTVPSRQDVPAFFADAAEIAVVRRIMVLPFASEPGVTAETNMLRSTFLAELAKIHRFEIVPLPNGADEASKLYRSLLHGRISTETLAALGQRYNLDGVLLGTVTGYRPYKPPQLGLRVQLLSLHSATAVWAAEAYYDTSDATTVLDVRHYTKSYLAERDSLHGWELILISPERFAAFVAHRIIGTWQEV